MFKRSVMKSWKTSQAVTFLFILLVEDVWKKCKIYRCSWPWPSVSLYDELLYWSWKKCRQYIDSSVNEHYRWAGRWNLVQLSWMFEFLHKPPIGNALKGSGLQSVCEKCTKWISGDTLNERGGFVCVQIIIQLISGAVTVKQTSGGLESSMKPSDWVFLPFVPHWRCLC